MLDGAAILHDEFDLLRGARRVLFILGSPENRWLELHYLSPRKRLKAPLSIAIGSAFASRWAEPQRAG